MRVLRTFAGVCICVFTSFVIYLGLSLLWRRMEAHLSGLFYEHVLDVEPAGFYFVTGIVAFASAAYATLRRRASPGWLLLGGLLLLLDAISIPSSLYPVGEGPTRVMETTRRVQDSLFTWGTKHGHLPANEKDLAEAVGPAFGGLGTASPYVKKGKRLDYRVVYEANAAGPHLGALVSPDPALIYCAVSPDRKQSWLTATALENPVDERAVLLSDPVNGRPWSLPVTLPAAPPPTERP
jgi:hypothetical protein